MIEFALSPTLDVESLRDIYARYRRLQIVNFLEDGAARLLHRALAESVEWRLTVNRGEQVLDYSREAYEALSNEQKVLLQRGVVAGGRAGFQFCYHTIRTAHDGSPDAPLARFQDFMGSAAVLDLMREVTGAADIATADAHASRYGPGQFLTTHDDRNPERQRRAAYVLNLTPKWRPDWGGLLLFYDQAGNVSRGFTPGFNTLNLFAVPQPHGVSWVNPLAGALRYAVTGWLLAPDAA